MDMNKIANEVAALTPEQKRNMGVIYKKYIKALVSVVLIAVIVMAALFIYFNAQAKMHMMITMRL